MEGVVTKLEARVVNPYSNSPDVVGTNVTVQHEAYAQEVRHFVTSTVFLPPNSVLPMIGDEVVLGVIVGTQPPAFTDGGDIEFPAD